MRAPVTCLVCSLAVLAACSKPPARQEAAPAAKAPAGPAFPFGRPHPKLGLWRMSFSTDSGPGISIAGDMCIDAKTESSAFEASPRSRGRNCSEPTFSPNPGGGVTFDGACKINGRTITSHGVASGDFSSAYVVDVTTHMDPPLPGGVGGGHSRIEAHWVGPCLPDQRPGQMTGMHLARMGRG